MTMIRFEPRNEFVHAQRKLRRFLNEFEGAVQGGVHFEMGSFNPRVDIAEDEKSVHVHAELPGLSTEDVKLTISEGVLTIRGEKKRQEEQPASNFVRIERSFGAFVRQFTLPENLQDDAVTASFTNGVLEITIPKSEPVKPKEREVPITSATPKFSQN
jgi:HSP20 family protein